MRGPGGSRTQSLALSFSREPRLRTLLLAPSLPCTLTLTRTQSSSHIHTVSHMLTYTHIYAHHRLTYSHTPPQCAHACLSHSLLHSHILCTPIFTLTRHNHTLTHCYALTHSPTCSVSSTLSHAHSQTHALSRTSPGRVAPAKGGVPGHISAASPSAGPSAREGLPAARSVLYGALGREFG